MTNLEKFKKQISKPYFSLTQNCTFRIVMNESMIVESSDSSSHNYADHLVLEVANSDLVHKKPPSKETKQVFAAPHADLLKWEASLGRITDYENFSILPTGSFRPTLANIDQIVRNYADAMNIQINPNQTSEEQQVPSFYVKAQKLVQHNAGANHDYRASTINGEPCDESQFKAIKTVGDGTCFVHSILLSISDTYRKCTDQGAVGRYIRSQLRLPGTSGVHLQDDAVEKMALLFGIGILYFQALFNHTYSCSEVGNTKSRCIIIVNENAGHYMAVTYKKQFIVNNVDIECEYHIRE